jgi:KRAB domain-containing zinc finger protein
MNIRGEEHLGEQSAEFSELKKEERFDSCEIYRKPFSRNNNTSGHGSSSNREIVSSSGTSITLFTHKRKALAGFRGLERRFSCDVCKKHFITRNYLDTHTRVHIGERPFSCEMCKNFSCKVCKRKFTQRSNLKSHLRIHNGERPSSYDVGNSTHMNNNRQVSVSRKRLVDIMSMVL